LLFKIWQGYTKPRSVTHRLVLTSTSFGWAGQVMRMEESDIAEKVLCTVLNQKRTEVEEKVDQIQMV